MIGCQPVKRWRWWGRRLGAGRLGDCVKDDMEGLGLQSEWAVFRDMLRVYIMGPTLAEHGRNIHLKNKQ